MRKLGSVLSVVFLLLPVLLGAQVFDYPYIPAKYKTPEQQLEYLSLHFWDSAKDAGGRALLAEDGVLEQAVVDFVSVVGAVPERTQRKAVRRFARILARGEGLFGEAMEYVEKYLYGIDSPLRDDRLYGRFVERVGGAAGRYLREEVRKNLPGGPATDFTFLARDGRGGSLREACAGAEYLLLFFYDEDCDHCRAAIGTLREDPFFAFCAAVGKMAVLGVDVTADPERWAASGAQLPDFCTDARVADPDFFTGGKYLFREMPGIYLLDRSGTVLLNEVRLQSVVEAVKSR